MVAPCSGTLQQGRKRSAAAAGTSSETTITAGHSRAPPVPGDSIGAAGQSVSGQTAASPRTSRNESSLLTPEPAGKRRLHRAGQANENDASNSGGDDCGGTDDGQDAGLSSVFTPGTNTAHLLLQLRSSWSRGAMSPAVIESTAASELVGSDLAAGVEDHSREGVLRNVTGSVNSRSGGQGSGGGDGAARGPRPTFSTAQNPSPAVPQASSLPPKKRPKTIDTATGVKNTKAGKPGRNSGTKGVATVAADGGRNRRTGNGSGGGGGGKKGPAGAAAAGAAVAGSSGRGKSDGKGGGKDRTALGLLANGKKDSAADDAAVGRGGSGRATTGQPQRRSRGGRTETAAGMRLRVAAVEASGVFGGEYVAGAGAAVTVAAEGCCCKKSMCLKLYCQCFAGQLLCSETCKCENCYNTTTHEFERKTAVRELLCRSPHAFDAKICKTNVQTSSGSALSNGPALVHTTGCGCSKSACLKRYCECFNGGIACSDKCRCKDCKNTMGEKGSSATRTRNATVATPANLDAPPVAGKPLRTLKRAAEPAAAASPQAGGGNRARVSAPHQGEAERIEISSNGGDRLGSCQSAGGISASSAVPKRASYGAASPARSPLGELQGF